MLVFSRTRAAILLIGVTLVASACASSYSRSNGRTDVITREEIMEADQQSLYDVVQRLRPTWLRSRGGQGYGEDLMTVVYQNQTQLGGLDVLRSMDPLIASELQYLDGTTAAASLPGLGSRRVQGAIVIHTRPRS